MNRIRYINVNELYPHPDNPRKSVGDVTELANSIRHSGVMQNLTVVPFEGAYRVVIGHRRLAAAKLAGLTELPCVVSDMDAIEQLHTMMSENMQRKDLTPVEEAFGVQMLLDLGESAEDVQQKTGMSRTTFYHRKAMAALPKDELQKSYERGGTIADYIALEQIKDRAVREKLLQEIGTKNFEYKLSQEKSKQALKELVQDVLLLLEPVAKKLNDSPRGASCWKYIYIQKSAIDEVKKAVVAMEADSAADYSFVLNTNNYGSGWLYIYRDGPDEEKVESAEEITRKKKEKLRRQRIDSLDKLHDSFREQRLAFIREFREKAADLLPVISVFLAFDCYIDMDDVMRHVFGSKGDVPRLRKLYKKFCIATPCAILLGSMELKIEKPYDCWSGEYEEVDEDLDPEPYLRLLQNLGYQMSDDEKAYWNGTHDLYLKEDETNV